MGKLYVSSVRRFPKTPILEEMKSIKLQKGETKIKLIKLGDIYTFFTIGKLNRYDHYKKETVDKILSRLIKRNFIDTEIIGKLY